MIQGSTEYSLQLFSIIVIVVATSFSAESWSITLNGFVEGQAYSNAAQTPCEDDEQNAEKSASSEYSLDNSLVRINENVGSKSCFNERYYKVLHYFAVCVPRINEKTNLKGYAINSHKLGLQLSPNTSIPIAYRRLLI